jgi:SSS family solute:Na+ symporter
MQTVDYVIIVLYVLGILGAGMVFAGKMKSSKEMFAAGGQSPWWVSGLSAFMTMFSAGTFVIWGGIAYKYGVVAIAINLCYGIAALLTGWLLAGVWRKAGVDSASEFLQLRYGGSIVQFYTWFKGSLTLFSTGGAVYALSKIVCALMPLPVGHLLADPLTGHLSVTLTSIAICIIVIAITFVGGLWAVLMTDVLQFVILTVSIIFVVPLIAAKVGGFGSFVEQAPDGFLSPVAAQYSWWFLIGWMIINFFALSGDWAFVQRWVCVPTEKDAKKAAYLIGGLYLVSPIFWMIPPLLYRVIQPGVDPEQAYILACKYVLPAGMLGLMVAAMASATASMATTRLNVYAGAFTEAFHRFFLKEASESRLVFVGRMVTILLGLFVMAGALMIPKYGYTDFIIDINKLLYVPLFLPTVWGLFSKKLPLKAVWFTTITCFVVAFILKFGHPSSGFLANWSLYENLLLPLILPSLDWAKANSGSADLIVGILLPFIILLFFELISKKEYPGWSRVDKVKKTFQEQPAAQVYTLPGKMVAICLVAIALLMAGLAFLNREEASIFLTLTLVLLTIGGVLYYFLRKADQQPSKTGAVVK